MKQVLGYIISYGKWQCPHCERENDEANPTEGEHYEKLCEWCGELSDVGF